MLPEVGIHKAKLSGKVVIVDRADENPPKVGLQVFLPCICADGKTITAIVTLIDKNGAVQTNTWAKFRKIFDGYADPTEMFAADQSGKEFEIDVQDETYNGETRRKVKWVNVIGEGGGMALPKASDAKQIRTKYGSQFRALAGGSPVKPAAAPSAPKPPAAPSAPTSTGCTKDEAWNAFVNDRPGAKHEEVWFNAMREVGKNETEYTPQDWAALKAKLLSDNQLPG